MISEASTHKKQNDILEAAAQLFLERGYEGVSVDAIVERVGGSKSTVYSYFGGKDGLFIATLKKLSDEMLRPLLELDVSAMQPEAGLAAIGTEFLKILSCTKGRALFFTMVGEARRFPSLGSGFFAAGPGACVRTISQRIELWQQHGLLRSGDPNVIAEQYLGSILGTVNIALLLGVDVCLTPKEIRKRVAMRTQIFMEGAGAHAHAQVRAEVL